MDVYFNFIKKIFYTIGFDIDNQYKGRWRVVIPMGVMKYTILVYLFIGMMQSWIYSISLGFSTKGSLKTAMVAFFSMRSFIIFVIYVFKLKDIVRLMKTIGETYESFGDEAPTATAYFQQTFKISKSVFYVNMVSIWSYGLSAAMNFATFLMNPTDDMSEILSYELYWPFDHYHYLPYVILHMCVFGHLFQISTLAMNQLLIYSTIYLSSCFDRFCEDIRDTINDCDKRDFLETRQKFAKCVQVHNDLIECGNLLNSLFGPFLVLFIIEASILICFLGFLAITEEPVMAATAFGAMINHLFDVFILCFIGEKLKTASTDVAEELARSEHYKIDKHLTKNIIIMMSMAQRSINLSAMGLFTYEHTNFSEVCNKSYSYMSILKRLY